MSNIKETLDERGSRYGDFSDNARVAQALKRVIEPYRKKFSDIHNEGLDLIFAKICRICNGDPDYFDNWRDIAGYATLVEERLQTQPKTKQEFEGVPFVTRNWPDTI